MIKFNPVKKTEKTQPVSDKTSQEGITIIGYNIEETINMKFGGRKTTYTVSSIDLIATNELGPDNKRVVKPKFVKVKPKEETKMIDKLSPTSVVNSTNFIKPVNLISHIPDGKLQYTKIKIIENYERVLEKGYKTEEMLQVVGDYHYFANDLISAAKWYSELFDYCPNQLEPVYYFRYAKSLEGIGLTEKAEQMMALYQTNKL